MGNIDYEDFRVGFSDWPGDIKATTPFGQMPVLYWDGEELAQSMAIARFVARKVGLAGNSDLEFCQADMIACHYEDIWTKLPSEATDGLLATVAPLPTWPSCVPWIGCTSLWRCPSRTWTTLTSERRSLTTTPF